MHASIQIVGDSSSVIVDDVSDDDLVHVAVFIICTNSHALIMAVLSEFNASVNQ